MTRLSLLIALSLFSIPAFAEDIVEAPPSTEASVHVAHYVGVNSASEHSPVFSAGTSLEFRVLFARRFGAGLTMGADYNEFDVTLFVGGGPRVRLTDPSSFLDVTLGYDLRLLSRSQFQIIDWGPPPESINAAAHVLTLRLDGPMSPSGMWRVGGYAEAGIAHNGVARWGSLGLSVGFGGRH